MPNKFSVLYVDPPYWYAKRSSKNKTRFGGGAERHYPLMKDSELLAMSDWVRSISADNSIIFQWITCPRLDFAIALLKRWGFRYCTVGFTWIKIGSDGNPIYGPGHYTASNTECVIIGVRGRMEPFKKLMPSVIFAPRGEHSVKPEGVRTRIEFMYPFASRKIELFAREPHSGWITWGMTGDMTSPDFIY